MNQDDKNLFLLTTIIAGLGAGIDFLIVSLVTNIHLFGWSVLFFVIGILALYQRSKQERVNYV